MDGSCQMGEMERDYSLGSEAVHELTSSLYKGGTKSERTMWFLLEVGTL